jgi:pimeloyl-ACP methyl ester carboxylesterase
METISMRVHGDASKPTLIYLPGMHGDWTLIGSLRVALRDRVRFVEFTYPRSVPWSLDDYACAVLSSLRSQQIARGWLLAESFSSLVAWSMVQHADEQEFTAEGIILAGGFVRYPYPVLVRIGQWINRRVSMRGLKLFLSVYSKYAVFRHWAAPETFAQVQEFVQRRCQKGDREAICGRYDLIAKADFQNVARDFPRPVYQLYGLIDPIVPAIPVRRWLTKQCKSHRQSRMIWHADHNVLGTAPEKSAEQIVDWMGRR